MENAPSIHSSDAIDHLHQAIAAEMELVMGQPARIEALCTRLRGELSKRALESRLAHLRLLLPLLRKQLGARVAPVFALIEEDAASCPEPWPLLEGMLAARDRELAMRALDLAAKRVSCGTLAVNRRMVLFLAAQAEREESPLGEPAQLGKIATILARFSAGDPTAPDPVAAIFLGDPEEQLRRLAARILDMGNSPASPALAGYLLGEEAHSFLRPYLEYTRATHLDLLRILPGIESEAPILEDLRKVEETCGQSLIKEVIAELGWDRVNLGIGVRPQVGISIAGSFPLTVLLQEAPILESCEEARRVFDFFLFTAHGGMPEKHEREPAVDDTIARFRTYNLAHAEALADILDLAPLTREKVERILARMDRIVEDYAWLFASHSEEVPILPGLYAALKQRIGKELEKEGSSLQLSAELTRLVQMFEDPPSLGRVQTLHGLKRYLHQKGLQLGLRLVQGGRSTNRTVDMVVASRRRISRVLKSIRYVNFEPERQAGESRSTIPYPVALLAEALTQPFLHGQEGFPGISVFCYGNEVHYYLTYKNHPAFLRIDFSPPLQGGMIDLEYYGVSKYEISVHPNLSLDAVCLFFRRLDFDVQVESTRIHARYDKERAFDLEDLCEKSRALFALAPCLMDIDWVIGNLELSGEARREVAARWADRFALWGSLPIHQLLTRDRTAILAGVEFGPEGEREIPWAGVGPYRDRFAMEFPKPFLARLHTLRNELEPGAAAGGSGGFNPALGQLQLERHFLAPLRRAAARGELEIHPGGIHRCSPSLFQRVHEAEEFAALLDSSDEAVATAASLANLIAPLERILRFQTTGSINGFEVQRAHLVLHGERLGLYALRDGAGIIRLALFTRDDGIWRRRRSLALSWESNACREAATLALLLRRANFPLANPSPTVEVAPSQSGRLRECFRKAIERLYTAVPHGERTVVGLKASPGRAVGRALLGTAGRQPSDLAGAILVAPSVRPEDSAFLYRSAGIVSTGGGVLSHAGLIAVQFKKPALIIPGQWQGRDDGTRLLRCRTLEFHEEHLEIGRWHVTLRRQIREQECELREGDLVVLDADEGTLCILGQSREILALHDSFQLFTEASHRLVRSDDPREILVLRGWKLRARHQIEKLLGRLKDPVPARHAVREILLGRIVPDESAARGEKGRLLLPILGNRTLGDTARGYLLQIAKRTVHSCRRAHAMAIARIPDSRSVFEILSLRLEALRLLAALRDVAASMRHIGLEPGSWLPSDARDLDIAVRSRLGEVRDETIRALERAPRLPSCAFRMRQLSRQVERIDGVLGGRFTPGEDTAPGGGEPSHSGSHSAICSERYVLDSESCGFGLAAQIGWKAANLAEIDRLAGRRFVPPWFVVTDRAFEEMLNSPPDRIAPGGENAFPGAGSLREAIQGIIARSDMDCGQKSACIRGLWERVALPQELTQEIRAAYRLLALQAHGEASMESDPSQPFVAIRSSAREEDAEIAARAGEFETFLFVRGEENLPAYLKRAWSGLWTERAIHNRAVLGASADQTGGGVLVQRIVWSRASGVLQTVNVAERDMREILINAGLGLGEGVVSGAVAADQIVVDKDGDLENGPLRFRYITADKRQRVVFNRRMGTGTLLEETLYHQRLRPVLEYVELAELVGIAAMLEDVYGYPLDIEFGIEGTRLWILQVRPVASFLAALKESTEDLPLSCWTGDGAQPNYSHAGGVQALKHSRGTPGNNGRS